MSFGKRMRVAVIVPGGIGTGRSNIGVPVLEQQVILMAKTFDIVVFSLFQVNDGYRPEGFEIISIPGRTFFSKAWVLFEKFRKLHDRSRFDVIHGFWILPSGFFTVTLGKYFKIGTVISILGGDAASLPEINYGQLRKWIPGMLVRWTIRNAAIVTALTGYLVESLEKNGAARPDIHIVPWGISNGQFTFNPVPVKSPLAFLHVANFSPVKDQLTLLRAFKLISARVDCHLTMIGEGPLEHTLHDYVMSNGLSSNVSIIPPVRYQELPAFYHSAMILLHSSLSEGQSEVVTEAMSSGVLVCGTRVGLLHDLSSCCVAVPVKDHQALADEVLRLIEDPERIALIRMNARDWTHRHNLEWTVNVTGEFYNKLASFKK